MAAAFVDAVFPELPDAFALAEPVSVARRLEEAFEFVVHAVPPAFQVYRGAPGLHVRARNSDDDVTVVETHTAHVPFIFESLRNYFQAQGLRVVSAIHPIFAVRRQWERIVRIGDAGGEGVRELYCQFRIERLESPERLRRLEHQVHAVLKSVFLAVQDFPEMRRALHAAGARLRGRPGTGADAEAARAFLEWLIDDNFVVLGTLEYTRGADDALMPNWTSGRGVCQDPQVMATVFPGLKERLASQRPPGAAARLIDAEYCPTASAIHYLEPLDIIAVHEPQAANGLPEATVVIGRLAKSAASARPQDIPVLRDKLTWLLEHSGVAAKSHVYRATRAAFNQFPKQELLYADVTAIKAIIDPLVRLTGDGDVAIAARRGDGYRALHVAFPAVQYSHHVNDRLTTELTAAIGRVSFRTWADCGDAALLVFYFADADVADELDLERVRGIVVEVTTTWADRTAAALDAAFGPTDGRRLFRRYIRAEERSGLYREITSPDEVPGDLILFEQLQDRLEIRILPRSAGSATLKLLSSTPLELVTTLRTLEHLGLVVREEVSVPLLLPEGRRGFLQKLEIETAPTILERLSALEPILLDGLRALFEGRTTNDPLNGLLLAEGLRWREIALLRTLRNYLLQVRPHYTSDTLTTVLLANSRVAAALFGVFAARFEPDEPARASRLEAADAALEQAESEVSSVLHDEVLKAFENVVRALLRTNFYQQPERPVLALKVDCQLVDGLPAPRPLFEIYVHSPKLEGVHLRGGRVARGGIRWSDRPDDFRAEILGLMRTQMLKNSIIVPVGSKGGFVLRGGAGARAAQDGVLVERYREFIAGLLDITDNRVDGAIEHPPAVVRYDDDDPYLVVAADKGTAHLSDTANQVSAQYGFWLGDAFASGGSNGYDHKKEGITARGAWASVEHHFRILGIDPSRQPFTVVGIGDMSGDVFGNGLLRSRCTKLVGAFNHQHIFLDPDPDPSVSFAERERLFALPRSTWSDYDRAALGPGGGVFDRQAKAIPLSPQAQALLRLTVDAASGEEVIRRLLCAEVDLLYNGGIGTYVRASDEDPTTVADRANDRVRVTAADLRARVVAEGGNLGLTDRARIEYWARGGMINTDAVDNSGGVSMSDHEVNIKILLDMLLREGRVSGQAERSALLVEMTDEVSNLVLEDNVAQARALTLDGRRSARHYDDFLFALDHLLLTGAADRSGGLPRREVLSTADRQRGFPRPVLAVMMATSKNWGAAELAASPVVDSDLAVPFLHAYFPARIRERFGDRLAALPLRREIVAMTIVNHVVNWAGLALIPRLMAASGRDPGAVVAAYLAAEQVTGGGALRLQVIAAHLDVEREIEMLLEIEAALEQATRERLQIDGPADLAALDAVRVALGTQNASASPAGPSPLPAPEGGGVTRGR